MKIESDKIFKLIDGRANATVGMNSQYAQGYRDALRHLKEEVTIEIAYAEIINQMEDNKNGR